MADPKNLSNPDFFGEYSVQTSDPLSADWQVIEDDGNVTAFIGGDGNIYAGNKDGSKNFRLRRKNGGGLRNDQNGWKIIALDRINEKNTGIYQNSKSGLLQEIKFDSNWRVISRSNSFTAESEKGQDVETNFNQYLGYFSDDGDSTPLDNSILATGWQRRDRNYRHQWSLRNTGQRSGYRAGKDIEADAVFNKYSYPSLGINHDKAWRQNLVAILDTGVNYRHSDLSQNLARWSNSEPLDGLDNDKNGFVDDIAGWDFVGNDNNANDESGHGTHVAGISNAAANGTGIVGSNPGGYYLPVRVLGRNGGSTANVIRGINYARARGSKVINMSLGGSAYSKGMYNAIKSAGNAGALVIAAAGNEFQNIDKNPAYPAAYNLGNIISVAASDPTDWFVHPKNWGWGTNYGRRSVDLLAPGQSILSGRHYSTSGLIEKSGTSMAAPLVAGAISFFWARNPDMKWDQVKKRVLNRVDKIPDASKFTVSGGRFNFRKLMGGIKPTRNYEADERSTIHEIDSFESFEGDPLIEYVPTITKSNVDSIDHGQITDKVITFFDGDVDERKEKFNKIKDFLSSSSRFSDHVSRIELMDSLESSIGVLDFRDKLSSTQRHDLIQTVISNGWVSEFEMDSNVAAF
uniref:S8 family serine peptidase n=1 Tax=Synechococcus sp. UW69 TaxID=368493 RepID=UPI000E0EF7AD|nr:S8 family serine peptidase [Synechococcus sp. UW69]